MAGPPTRFSNLTEDGALRKLASELGESIRSQLPPSEWPGMVLVPFEWGAVAMRVLLAAAAILITLQVPELDAARPAMLIGFSLLLVLTPVYVVLLRRQLVLPAMYLAIVTDTVIVIGTVLVSGKLLNNAGIFATPNAAQGLSGSVPMIIIVMVSAIRLKPVPGVLYAILVPVTITVLTLAMGVNQSGLDGVVPRTISMSFAGIGIIALAYPLQRARRQMAEAMSEKVELVSTVAHELRGPLTSTRAYVELIHDGAAGEISEQQRSMLERAMRSTSRMEQLIGLFLHVERAENDEVPMVLETVDLGSVANDMMESIAPLAADREIEVVAQNIDGLPSVSAERGALDQVLANFLSNAVKFSPDRSTVRVAGYLEGDFAGLTVSDEGMGISGEDQRHIFQRFYRSADPRKRRVRGTGLGLYVSRRLIEKMHGRVWFTSEPGAGSTFGFSLPVARKAAPAPAEEGDDISAPAPGHAEPAG